MGLEIVPILDIREHTEGSTCKCNPEVQVINNEIIYVHHAYDGRDKDTVFFNNLELRQEQLN